MFCVYYSLALDILNSTKHLGFETSKANFDYLKKDFKNEGITYLLILNNYFYGKNSFEETENILFDNLIQDIKKVGISDWSKIGALLGSQNVFKVFNYFKDDLSDKDYWILLGECYVMSSFSHLNFEIVKSYFQSQRPYKIYIMNDEERREYESLPSEFVIYRGCSQDEIKSGNFRFSWTTKESVAKFFAKRNKLLTGKKNSVVSKIIKKEDAFAYFNSRNEFEIIYLPNS